MHILCKFNYIIFSFSLPKSRLIILQNRERERDHRLIITNKIAELCIHEIFNTRRTKDMVYKFDTRDISTTPFIQNGDRLRTICQDMCIGYKKTSHND